MHVPVPELLVVANTKIAFGNVELHRAVDQVSSHIRLGLPFVRR
jgi:hypothetical protein